MSAGIVPSFWRSLAVQRRVISALMLREMVTRFGRNDLGLLWLVLEPMLFTLGVAGVWKAMGLDRAGSSGMPIVAFAITGYSSVLMWRNTVGRCAGAIHANINLMFHRNVQVIDVMVARSLLEIGGATASFFLLTLIFFGAESILLPKDPLQVLGGWLMLAWFGLALSLTIGAATAYTPVVERIWVPAAYLLFPFSGAAFMADWLAPEYREVLLLLPMVHSVEFMREGFFGGVVRFHYDMAYMALCNLGLTLIALWLVRDAGRRLEAV